MEPVISQKSEMKLVGMSFFGDPFDTSDTWTEENQIGRLWQRFMGYLQQNANAIKHTAAEKAMYEVHIYHPETFEKGLFEIFVGVRVEQLEAVPVDLLVKNLPASEYAVFTLAGEQIASDWEMIIENWLARESYRRNHPFSYQYYDERFKGLENITESFLDVYLPIEKIEDRSSKK
ncbi:MAG: GyrI-like domain-containing protein [Anaerolineales bacterium]|nr:GyrI-like domain-containing protein [Chloroflexota bacterium]MBL6982685.1 GyrI-like domain-containing protein [Anaerolineales bacterium]